MRRGLIIAAAAAGLLAAGCRSARRGEPITGPLDTRSAAITRGEEVFDRHCHQCHPGGEGGLGPSLNDKPAPGWLMKTQVRAGLGAMPSFSEKRISDEELRALIAYLKALRRDR